jgi:hypothetical protein
MRNNQNVLVAVIFALVLVIGFLVYDRHKEPDTLGEQVGQTIDRAAGEMGIAVKRKD